VAEFFESAEEGRFEPLGGADFALVAELVNLGPVGKTLSALFADETESFIDVLGIRVALFDEAHGKAVGAEKEMDARGIGKLAEAFADVGDEGFDVKRMIVEVFNGTLRKSVNRFAVNAAPLFETAERGGIGIMGIERQEDKLIETAGIFKRCDSVFGKGLPVAHGSNGDRINVRLKCLDEADALAFGENGDGGATANHGVASGDGGGAFFGDVTGERSANEIGWAEGDDVWVEEEIAEEGFDGVEGIGAAKLEEDDADAFLFGGGHGVFLFFGRGGIRISEIIKKRIFRG